MYEGLKGYTPEKVTDGGGFEPFKFKGPAVINKAMIDYKKTEKYDGDIVQIEYQIVSEQLGARKLWSSFFMNDDKGQQKLANLLFTCGLEFTDKPSLELALEKFAELTVKVSAWTAKKREKVGEDWVTANPVEMVQQFKVVGLASDVDAPVSEKPKF